MGYRCTKCGAVFDQLPKGVIRCPKCASKVLTKTRDQITKVVKAR
ncbi:DNA-directed RNA polymerase subunit P [Candidatus Micrarchaeota archaeon]|nr:DNA-directed RNA polymerase subunit P [Candidatus Micrarchaeota archaeon]MBU1939475.1 DNA-directed RNA polymerase subunit P [Candidatus Micrarchaeota archaeon]MBU2260192.1 DNA-directed RNA polymerase subunit P [Patescibacteria group bacterium]